MGKALVIHNPKSGGRRLLDSEWKAAAAGLGLEPQYFELEDLGWKRAMDTADLLMVAGGDGTIVKVAKEQIHRFPTHHPIPMQIIPLGMANNIHGAVQQWKSLGKGRDPLVYVHLGRRQGAGRLRYFMEGLGWGGLAHLIHSAKERPLTSTHPWARRKEALMRLMELLTKDGSMGTSLELTVDGKDYSGDYALVEILNLPMIGPRLMLAPEAHPMQRALYLVRITHADMPRFLHCLRGQVEGRAPSYTPAALAFQNARIAWSSQCFHEDDRSWLYGQRAEAQISVWPAMMPFRV